MLPSFAIPTRSRKPIAAFASMQLGCSLPHDGFMKLDRQGTAPVHPEVRRAMPKWFFEYGFSR